MSAVSWRTWRLAFVVAVCAVTAARAETINVGIDEARIMHLPEGAATIVIGNPLIADASLQSGGILVITGRSFGATNMIALDHGGRVILDRDVQVQTARSADLVVVYRNDKRQSYSCAPECAPRITLGDDNGAFSPALAQSVQRLGAAGVR
jgi:Pilus formation protein N terminal region